MYEPKPIEQIGEECIDNIREYLDRGGEMGTEEAKDLLVIVNAARKQLEDIANS